MVFRFRSVFARLFVSVFLALIAFAIAMFLWIQLVHNDSETLKNRSIAREIATQIEPFLADIEKHHNQGNRLQARFSLAVIKKSFDIFDESLNAKIGLYSPNKTLILETDNSDLPKELAPQSSWANELMPTLFGHAPRHFEIKTRLGYIVWYESRTPSEPKGFFAMNLLTATLLLLLIMGFVLWMIAKNLTRRIGEMSRQMARLGEGQFDVRAKEEGVDEIADLAYGFNQSVEKIQQLINANRLLLAHASHEFRTPITRMRLQTEMLSMLGERLNDADKALLDKRTHAINRDLNGLNELIESILLVSRLDAGHVLEQMQVIDFYELVAEECQHFEQATLYGESVWLEAQAKLLTHLIRNLLNNALIHGVPPMTVYVYGCQTSDEAHLIPERLLCSALLGDIEHEDSASTDTEDNKKSSTEPTKLEKSSAFLKRLSRTPKNDSVPPINFSVLAVIDEGCGIPPEKRDDIFSPFVRLKQEKKGSGLGLSLVAQIVQMHQGKILTDTWQGKTRFLVIFPTRQRRRG